MITCLIVNLNCLNHVKNLINDLKKQTFKDFEIIMVDQNSIESGTKEYLESLKNNNNIKIIYNDYNKPLNKIWNEVIKASETDYVAFLNNDIRIPSNFLHDTVDIFNKERDVSIVIHPTNHPSYRKAKKSSTEYVILNECSRQGWDFSFRKRDWVDIPDCLDFYCGDDFIFENVYMRNKKVAMAISSPIIHLLSQTRKNVLNKVIPNRNPNRDVENYKKLGYKHYLNLDDKFSKLEPTFFNIEETL